MPECLSNNEQKRAYSFRENSSNFWNAFWVG